MGGRETKSGPLSGATVLVTGARGFIGGHVLEALRSSGAKVVATSRQTGGDGDGIRWITIPHWSPDALKQALGPVGWTWVIHAASYGVAPADRLATEMAGINVACAAALVSLAVERKAKAYVHVGSCAEYAAVGAGQRLDTGSILESVKLYGTSKACGTLISHAIAADAGLPFAAARLFNIYGPGEASHRLLPMLYANLSANRDVPLSKGEQVRDFCYAGDAADALVRMLAAVAEDNSRGGIYNVCSGQGTTVRAFALCVAAEMQKPAALLEFGKLPMRPDDHAFITGDPSRTAAVFGWTAQTPLRDGIRQSLARLGGETGR